MDDPRVVNGPCRPRQAVRHQLHCGTHGKRRPKVHALSQRRALQQLEHHVVEAVLGHAEVEHVDHEAVLDRGDHARLGHEALSQRGAVFAQRMQELDGDFATQRLVHRCPDRAHAALPELADQLELPGNDAPRFHRGVTVDSRDRGVEADRRVGSSLCLRFYL